MAIQSWGDYDSLVGVPELTKLVRHEPQPTLAFSQAAGAPDGEALGLNRGDTVVYTFYPDLDTAGGELSEYERVSTTGLTPIRDSYVITEYGNGTEYTGRLEDLNRLTTEDHFIQALRNDLRKLENKLSYDQAITSDWKYVFHTSTPEFKQNGTPTVTANTMIDLTNLGGMKTKALKNNIPFFDGESYLVVVGPEGWENLSEDASFQNLLKEDSGRAAMNGEIGRVKQCRLVVDNHKIAYATGALEEAVLMGQDAVKQDIARAVEIRREVADFGRAIALAYLWLGKYYKVLDQTTHGREHIIHATSA